MPSLFYQIHLLCRWWFNIKNTHLTDLERIEKLFSTVMIAFAWAYVAGVFVNDNIKPIRILNNGKRAKSLFKYGLEFIATALLNPRVIINVDIFKFLSCTLIMSIKYFLLTIFLLGFSIGTNAQTHKEFIT